MLVRCVLQRYAALTFNICPHKTLNLMTRHLLEIHSETSAKPRDFQAQVHLLMTNSGQNYVKADPIREEEFLCTSSDR